MLTQEQKKAIETKNTNILVSAGAGSGKTFVLTQRVLSHIKSGIQVDELLILTFTNAAAAEMKMRIYNKLKEENLMTQANKIDNADITTFDSFYLKLVKQFHYLLKIAENVVIGEYIYFEYVIKNMLNELFLEYSKDSRFIQFLNDYTIKSPKELQEPFINLIYQYDKVMEKIDVNIYFKEKFIYFQKEGFYKIIDEEKNNILENIRKLESLDLTEKEENLVSKIKENVQGIENEKSLEKLSDLATPKNLIKVMKSDNSTEIKEYNDSIKNSCKKIKFLCRKSIDQYIKEYVDTQKYVIIIDEIIQKVKKKLLDYKMKNGVFDFADISFLAIKLVNEHKEVKKYIEEKYFEVLVDEYQDTNDFQDAFINNITNNNCYMVGDVKQAIYGFRNANPKNFIDKEELYKSDSSRGVVINLKKNFRSRNEVLEGINYTFNNLMTLKYGTVLFDKNQELDFGSMLYEKEKNPDYNFKIINYDKKLDKEEDFLDKSYVEAFIIGFDIIKKIKNKFQIKSNSGYKHIKYSDIAILTSDKKSYDKYVEVFEHLNIIVDAQSDKVINQDYILSFYYSVLNYILTSDKLSLVSVMRSFVCQVDDQSLHEFLLNKVKSSHVEEIIDILNQVKLSKNKTCSEVFDIITESFGVYESILSLLDIKINFQVLQEIENMFTFYDKIGLDIKKLSEYLLYVYNTDTKKEIKKQDQSLNAVRIMTIHKSKGLEFPIVYLPNLSKSMSRKKSMDYFFSKKHGMILNSHQGLIKDELFIKEMINNEQKLNDISEAIRLFYVALTRAKEQFIFITSADFEKNVARENLSNFENFLQYHSPSINNHITKIYDYDTSLIKSLKDKKYKKNAEIEDNKDNVTYFDIDVKRILKTKHRASKKMLNILNEDEKKSLKLGTEIHNILEKIDFKSVDINQYSDELKLILSRMLKYDIFKTYINKYNEFEFIDGDTNAIIDLVLEFEENFLIVDYKLSDINSQEYQNQLYVYKNYLEKIVNKPVKAVLYSLLKDEFKEYND